VEEKNGVVVSGPRTLRGVDVDMNAMPDMVPGLVSVALCAEGSTRIRNVAHLRGKESNRLDTLADELHKLGADVRVQPDGFMIQPGPLHGGTVSSHDDHRLAMSFAILSLKVPGLVIEKPECVTKSFPKFWETFGALTGSTLTVQS